MRSIHLYNSIRSIGFVQDNLIPDKLKVTEKAKKKTNIP